MEVAPCYELLTLLVFLPPLTLLTLFEQLQSEKAMMLIHMIWVSFWGTPENFWVDITVQTSYVEGRWHQN